jgi:hypothetical protein
MCVWLPTTDQPFQFLFVEIDHCAAHTQQWKDPNVEQVPIDAMKHHNGQGSVSFECVVGRIQQHEEGNGQIKHQTTPNHAPRTTFRNHLQVLLVVDWQNTGGRSRTMESSGEKGREKIQKENNMSTSPQRGPVLCVWVPRSTRNTHVTTGPVLKDFSVRLVVRFVDPHSYWPPLQPIVVDFGQATKEIDDGQLVLKEQHVPSWDGCTVVVRVVWVVLVGVTDPPEFQRKQPNQPVMVLIIGFVVRKIQPVQQAQQPRDCGGASSQWFDTFGQKGQGTQEDDGQEMQLIGKGGDGKRKDVEWVGPSVMKGRAGVPSVGTVVVEVLGEFDDEAG